MKLGIFHISEHLSCTARWGHVQTLGFGFSPPAWLPLHPVTQLGEAELPCPGLEGHLEGHLEGQGHHPPRAGTFPERASLFHLQVEISCPGSELKGVPMNKGSQAAFQAPGASRDFSFFV